jgi:CubicO group peptidase (beta-lactamase class C family)
MSRTSSMIGSFALTTLIAACGPSGCGPSDITACDPNRCISESQFSANISNTLDNNVVGYVVIVGGMPSSFSGTARTSSDPPSTAMLPDLLANVASVSKVLTAIAVIQSLTNHGHSIDDSIEPYLFPDWSQSQGQGINSITFRQLLTHTSGFTAACNQVGSYAALKTQIQNGVMVHTTAYNNCNFSIFQELLPYMENAPQVVLYPTMSDSQRDADTAAFYINYMNQHVFQPLGIPARTCNPPTPNTTNNILGYPFPAGSTHGVDFGDFTLACPAGGWQLSAGDLFKVINDLANGNVLLTNAEQTEMTSNCLGWDGVCNSQGFASARQDCPQSGASGSGYFCQNGGRPDGPGIALSTYVGIFKCNVPVVVIVNSYLPPAYQTPGGPDIIDMVAAAYNNSGPTGTAQPCP